MVATAHNMSDGREERVARYKEERRRELEARYGPRISSQENHDRAESKDVRQFTQSLESTKDIRETKTDSVRHRLERSGQEKAENRSPSDNIRSTRASRLRTQANQLAQGHITRIPQPPDPLRQKSGDFSSIESYHKEEDSDKSARRKWKVTRSMTTDSTPASQQSSANSSPNNERKTKAKYTGASRSLSPGGMSNALGRTRSTVSNILPVSSPLPKSSQLVRKANTTRLSPGRRGDTSSITKPASSSGPASSGSYDHQKDRKSSPVRERTASVPPVRLVSVNSPRVNESSKHFDTFKFNDTQSKLSEASILEDNRLTSPQHSPVKHPAGILKKSSLDESSSQPISILKRKSSRDEGSGCVSPVKWSSDQTTGRPRATVILPASALNNLNLTSPANGIGNLPSTSSLALSRGILKKHRSLDEPPPHSLIIESANSQNGSDEMRPILKGQARRCSLEELKRNQSPDGHPQGILKRKTSSSNQADEIIINDADKDYLQGILKRKGSSPIRSNPDSPIRDSIFDDQRKPILKKKSSSEEPPDSPLLELSHPPRPILKKKSIDEEESPHTVKPILKTKYDDVINSSHDIKPILKHNDDKAPVVVLRSNSVRSSYQNRRSLDSNFVYMRPRSPSDERPSRPLSIAERILHLESSIDQELLSFSGRNSRMDEGENDEGGCGLTRSGSVSERASMWNKLEQESRAAAQSTANTRRLAKGNRGRTSRGDSSSRFNTQPVTLGEVEQARRNNQQQQQQLDCVDEDDEPSRLSLADRVRLFSAASAGDVKVAAGAKSQLPPAPRRHQPVAHSATSSIVSGLLKNLRDKAGSTGVKDRPVLKTSKSSEWDSSDDEGDDDEEGASTDSSDTESSPSLSVSPPRQKVNMVVGMVGGGGVVVRRCATEPMDRVRGATPATVAPSSETSAKDVSDESDGAPVVTIAERLAALQRSGSTDWRKRVKPLDDGEPNGGVAERLGKLETAAQGWKTRVELKDNVKFTVKGKMGSVPSSPISLLPPQVRGQPQPQIFSPQGIESMSTPVSPDMVGDSVLGFIKRSASAPGSDHLKKILNGTGSNESPGPIVTVPEVCDEEFHSFFPDYTPQSSSTQLSTLSEDIDFEHLTKNSTQLLVSKRRVRAQRKHHSANPLRALAQRSDLTSEYVEVRSGIAEKERIRLNLDKLSKANPGLAVEALAGLASKEELTSVVLRRSADSGPVKQVAQWSHPLLLRTKGRRHPVTSIVPPHYASINQGDAFTLVTSNQVFCWTGEFCNVIEKSRSTEVASEIQSRKDMGCLSASKVHNLDGTMTSPHHESFWRILKLPHDQLDSYKGEAAGHPDEDELYETAVSQSYRVYELSDGSLLPVEQAWARHPKIEFLQNSKVMVFDFVTEIFCWCGKGSSVAERKLGAKLANELAKEPAWTPCGISWLDSEVKRKQPRVYSVTQHMEPIIFREKFTDWPDFNRNNIGAKSENGLSPTDSSKACDIKPMLEWSLPQPDLILETSHLGRGNKYYDIETRRYYNVSSQNVKIWRIEDYAPAEVSESSFGHFIDSHSYIIRWKYTLTVTGRELSGEPSKHQALGRDRVAFWTWQGKHAGLEGGTASLLSVGMQQGAPQVMVKEGLEPPALQALMPSPALVIHSDKLSSSWPKLYLIEPGQDPTGCESPLIRQLPIDDSSLRSAASFLYLPRSSCSTAYLWHGCSTKTYYRKISYDAISKLLEQPSSHFKLSHDSIALVEVIEGNEPKDFFNGVVLRKGYCSEYYSKADDTNENEVKLKMFELTHVKGVYTAVPLPPVRFNSENKLEETWRYVYSQEELYSTVSQCVLVDAYPQGIWLWLRSSSPIPSAQALTTQLAYSVALSVEPQQVYVICQGTEPTDFRSLFPWWCEDLCFEAPEGWSKGEVRQSTEEISKLSLRTYTLHDLSTTPLPGGVDPTRLEMYLSEPQFMETFKMSREEFQSLPSWKQKKLKKSASIF